MKNRQISQVNMSDKTTDYLNSNIKIWETNKIIAEAVSKIKALRTEIDDATIEQKAAIKGITQKKSMYHIALIESTYEFTSMVCSYAINVNDPEIYQKFDIPTSSLEKMNDKRLPMLVKDVTNYVSANKDKLKAFGFTDALLKNYQTQTSNYIAYVDKPAETKGLIAAATKKLNKLMKELMNIYELNLDKTLVQYKTTHSDFYNNYKEARIIYNIPLHHLSIKGNVTDAETGEPLFCVNVILKKLKAGTELASKVKSTSKKGNYLEKGLEPGVWEITFEKYGYETYTVVIDILQNTMFKLDVKLKKCKSV